MGVQCHHKGLHKSEALGGRAGEEVAGWKQRSKVPQCFL